MDAVAWVDGHDSGSKISGEKALSEVNLPGKPKTQLTRVTVHKQSLAAF